jgi:hypothetical protein
MKSYSSFEIGTTANVSGEPNHSTGHLAEAIDQSVDEFEFVMVTSIVQSDGMNDIDI